MSGYTRQDTSNNIATGNVINAGDLDNEFDAIVGAFNNSTGHKHDGTSGEGPPITVTGPSQDVVTTATALRPKTDNTVDLGTSTFEYKDLYIDGVANIDSLVADTADINAGTIDSTVIGATTPAAGTFTALTATTGNMSTVSAPTASFTNATITSANITTLTLGGFTITTTATELNYVDGVTSSIQTQLNAKQSSDSDLTALAGLSTTGILVRTGTGTAAARTLAAGLGISIADAGGVSANPTISATLATGTALASTSGTTLDFTGIPAGVKRITVMFNQVSTATASPVQIQLGDSGGFETTGYVSTAFLANSGTTTTTTSTSGLVVDQGGASLERHGFYVINLVTGNAWVGGGNLNTPGVTVSSGAKTLSSTLDRIRITTVAGGAGVDTFDLGTVNIMWE